MITSVIGIDPGPATGLCFMDFVDDSSVPTPLIVCQSLGVNAVQVLASLLNARYTDTRVITRYAQVEQFRTGSSAGTKGDPADVTRQLVMELAETLQLFGYSVKIRPAASVKPWASDKRLIAAGFSKPFHGSMNHAYDAGRHALYCAVKDAGRKDPLR